MVFNVTSESIARVQNSVFLVEGYSYETYILIQSSKILDSFGNDKYVGFVHNTKGALFICKFCDVSQTMESSQRLAKIQELFEGQNYKFKSREKN